MTTVSVVIPFYNRAHWLNDAVASVLAQTFQDFEIIVVDDGSEERNELADRFSDDRIRSVRQDHRGTSSARNHGLRLATGKYVAFLDADDVFLPDKLRIQVGQMDARPDAALSHSSYTRMDGDGNELEQIRSGTFEGSVYPSIVWECPIATPTVMVRRYALSHDGLWFNESVEIGEDTILWIEVARRHQIIGLEQTLTKVRIHGRNAFSDPAALYRGGIAILRHVFVTDPSFAFATRRRLLARLCKSVSVRFQIQGNARTALRYSAMAAWYWPFDREILMTLARLSLPQMLRRAVRRPRVSEHRR